MSVIYEMGFNAASAGRALSDCPYEGASEGSRKLRARWISGYEAALSAPPKETPDSRYITFRKKKRRRWPRSLYAMQRLKDALNV